jgi:hypothetical protein
MRETAFHAVSPWRTATMRVGSLTESHTPDHDLAGRVAQAVGGTPAAPPDFRPLVQGAIDTTAREA